MEDQANNNNNNTTTGNTNISMSSSGNSSSSGISNSKGEKNNNNNNSSSGEAVRSRWTPKAEQILILESIFNSGMVNPPKEETVRIRKLLEKFGAVGDANVFYWFQNRRSRSRRRQRQLQASLAASAIPPSLPPPPPPHQGFVGSGCGGGATANFYDFGHPHTHPQQTTSITNTCTTSLGGSSSFNCFAPSSNLIIGGDSTSVADVFPTFSAPFNPTHHQFDSSSNSLPNLNFQSGVITVFLNGVATQVPEGPLDMKAMFGEEVILVHSSGVPVPFNDFGLSLQSLEHGESYFLVPRIA